MIIKEQNVASIDNLSVEEIKDVMSKYIPDRWYLLISNITFIESQDSKGDTYVRGYGFIVFEKQNLA